MVLNPTSITQLFALAISCISVLSDINPFMDNEWFSINWLPGSSESVAPTHKIVDEQGTVVTMMTSNREKYSCFVPHVNKISEQDTVDSYTGPSAQDFIEKLHIGSTCSYRIEAYWTYELCHGRYIRQYHGDKDADKIEGKSMFSLGDYTPSPPPTEQEILLTQAFKPKIKSIKLENIELPYFAVTMSGGTLCELTGKPRSATILYVCQPDGRGQIYQLKEMATCQYEVIVLTSILCPHPSYRPQQPAVHKIQCEGVNGAPLQPLKYLEYFPSDQEAKPQADKTRRPLQSPPKQSPPKQTVKQNVPANLGDITDKQTISSFFTGLHCIYGGAGWWRHEFCYGRHISQYHQGATGRTTIVLGKWSEETHRKWYHASSQRQTASRHRMLQLYYGEGDFCDETGKQRQTIVKIKCQEHSTKPHSITLYLMEVKVCEYQLVVESMLFCGVLNQANGDGVLYKPTL